jgi:hypothetical protein
MALNIVNDTETVDLRPTEDGTYHNAWGWY